MTTIRRGLATALLPLLGLLVWAAPAHAATLAITNSPMTSAGAASDSSQYDHSDGEACRSYSA